MQSLMPTLRSPYRWPLSLKRTYLRPSHYYYFIKGCVQRLRWGASESDEFSFDHYFSTVLLNTLPNFKNDEKYGRHVIFSYPPMHMMENLSEEEEAERRDTWDAMIDAIWSAIYDLYGDDVPFENEYDKTVHERFVAGICLLGEIYRGLWW